MFPCDRSRSRELRPSGRAFLRRTPPNARIWVLRRRFCNADDEAGELPMGETRSQPDAFDAGRLIGVREGGRPLPWCIYTPRHAETVAVVAQLRLTLPGGVW